MAHRSKSERDSTMTVGGFEHALDHLHDLKTRPLARPRAAPPGRMAYESGRLDAAALFDDLPIVAPPALAEVRASRVVVAGSVAPMPRPSSAPPLPYAYARRASSESRLIPVAVLGALALVATLAAYHRWSARPHLAADASAQVPAR